jgi:hypothetical protein
MNWDTAPQELESLRAQVVALTKEVELARFGNVVKYGTSHPEMYKSELDVCKEQLAAAQAHAAQLREALETISDEENWGEDGCWESSSYPDEIANEALATPTDTSALDARLKDEYLKGFSDGAANYATEAIREIK